MDGLASRLGWAAALCFVLGATRAEAQELGRLVVSGDLGSISVHCEPSPCDMSSCASMCIRPGGATFDICSDNPGFEILCCRADTDCGSRMRPSGSTARGTCVPLLDYDDGETGVSICSYPCLFDLCVAPGVSPDFDDLEACIGEAVEPSGERTYAGGDCDGDGFPNFDPVATSNGTFNDCGRRPLCIGDAGVTPIDDGGTSGDAGMMDADVAIDAGVESDSGTPPDAGSGMDGGGRDGGGRDGGSGGGGGPGPGFRGRGSGCAAAGGAPGSLAALAVAVAALALGRRRRKLGR